MHADSALVPLLQKQLREAAEKGDSSALAGLLLRGAPVDSTDRRATAQPSVPSHVSCTPCVFVKRITAVLLSAAAVGIHLKVACKRRAGNTPLHLAALYGHGDCVQKLLVVRAPHAHTSTAYRSCCESRCLALAWELTGGALPDSRWGQTRRRATSATGAIRRCTSRPRSGTASALLASLLRGHRWRSRTGTPAPKIHESAGAASAATLRNDIDRGGVAATLAQYMHKSAASLDAVEDVGDLSAAALAHRAGLNTPMHLAATWGHADCISRLLSARYAFPPIPCTRPTP